MDEGVQVQTIATPNDNTIEYAEGVTRPSVDIPLSTPIQNDSSMRFAIQLEGKMYKF